ncbi:MAG: hypothetical protein D4R88_00495 [Methanosarcinales archaeon]|nr:MAG: hypothetical protein D4R88_00495 [Methanosarcinales archaeon]
MEKYIVETIKPFAQSEREQSNEKAEWMKFHSCNRNNCESCNDENCKCNPISQADYNEPDFGFSWNDQQQSNPLNHKSRLTRSKVLQVRAITKAGGNPFRTILYQPGSEDQYKLLMIKFKIMGIERPTVRPWHFISSQERSNLIADYASGIPVKQICEKYHVSDSVVYHNGVISRKPPVRSPQFQAEVLKMYNEGKSANEISNVLDVHHQVTRCIILKAHPEMTNLTDRRFVRLTKNDTDEILKLFNSGMIIAHIAKMTKHSKSTVERVVGHIPGKSYKKNDERIIDDLRTSWTLGNSLAATAKKFNRAKSTVKFHFDKFKRGL